MRLYKEFSENCKDQPHDVQNTLNSTHNFQTKKQINLNLDIRKKFRVRQDKKSPNITSSIY